jgi:flagellar biosynthesis protein FlhG
MLDSTARDSLPPADQADGLRRLFAGSSTRFIAVAANPNVAFAGLALERLAAAASACSEPQRKVLVVDTVGAAPHEMAMVDLAACIEPLDDLRPNLSYLAARGLPLRPCGRARLLRRLPRSADRSRARRRRGDRARRGGRAGPPVRAPRAAPSDAGGRPSRPA